MREIIVPPVIENAMRQGATIAVNISGGKDGQAMAAALIQTAVKYGWNALFALHMDLGRAEWKQTPAHVERIAANTGLPLVVTRRPQGDLIQEIEDRMNKLMGTERPFWPSASNRYCTADQKRSQADKVYRDVEHALNSTPFWPSASNRYCTAHHKTNQADKVYRQYEIVISAEGIRSQESKTREKKSPLHMREQITAKPLQRLSLEDALIYRSPGQRLGINWYPIFDWSIDDVWEACGTTAQELEQRREMYRDGLKAEALNGWPAHPAYVFGNQRVSCALCILAIDNDIRNGAEHNPGVYRLYRDMEIEGGFTFKHGKSLAEIVGEE